VRGRKQRQFPARQSLWQREIADRAMKDKGLSDKRIRAMFISTFLVRLGQMQRSGRLEKTRDGRGPTMRWKLADGLA
jgi:hypothetical protein